MFEKQSVVVLLESVHEAGLNAGDFGRVVQVFQDEDLVEVACYSLSTQSLVAIRLPAKSIRVATSEEVADLPGGAELVESQASIAAKAEAQKLLPKLGKNKDDATRPVSQLALDRYKSLDEKLKQWLILYGVGIATLFITQTDVMSGISSSRAYWIILLSLFPAFVQLAFVLLLKYTMLVLYRGYSPDEPSVTLNSRRFQIADKWATWVWPDVLLDLSTAAAYFVATLLLVTELSSTFGDKSPTVDPRPTLGAADGDQEKERQKEKEGRQEERREEEGGQEEKEGRQEEDRQEDVSAPGETSQEN